MLKLSLLFGEGKHLLLLASLCAPGSAHQVLRDAKDALACVLQLTRSQFKVLERFRDPWDVASAGDTPCSVWVYNKVDRLRSWICRACCWPGSGLQGRGGGCAPLVIKKKGVRGALLANGTPPPLPSLCCRGTGREEMVEQILAHARRVVRAIDA